VSERRFFRVANTKVKRAMKKLLICCALILLVTSMVFSQKPGKTKPAAKAKPIIFAIINDGQTLEPIGQIDKGELVGAASDNEEKALQNFANAYYKPKTTYNLIFGGAVNGTVTVKSSDPKSECGKNLAQVSTISSKAKLKGLVMGLATNQNPAKSTSGMRRLPTPTERVEIESLVRAEFTKQGVLPKAVKNMKYYNLTALDVDADGKAEMVGSFWTENSSKERNLLFFIAEKNKSGKYNFGYSEYEKVTPDKIMSGELKDLDELGGELLLDSLDYNGDANAEIFTINKAFEGNNFNVYSRKNGKWTKIFEGYNYHCAY
jgi:hypothetical protein